MRLGQEEQAREEQAAAEAAQVKEDRAWQKEQAKADEKAAREAEKESAAKEPSHKIRGEFRTGDNRPCGGKIDRRQRRRKSGQECGRKSWSKPCPRTSGNFLNGNDYLFFFWRFMMKRLLAAGSICVFLFLGLSAVEEKVWRDIRRFRRRKQKYDG